MATALITGIEGFTGRYLAQALRVRGHDVVGTTREGPASADELRCDVTDLNSVRAVVREVRADYVVHLAGISFVGHGQADAFYQVNLLGTLHLLQAIHEANHPVAKVLLASSANVYGNTSAEPIDESVAPVPVNDYAVSKLAMEHLARLWFDRLPIVIARPFNYTGVGQDRQFLLPKIVAHYRQRAAVLELGNLDVARDFSDVRVVAECYRRLLECEVRGVVLNVCSGRAHSLREVLALAGEIAGYSPEIRLNPAFMRANEVRRLVGSRRQLENCIGPVADIPLRDTLRWMFEGGD